MASFKGNEFLERGDDAGAGAMMEEFRTREWKWANGESTEAYILKGIRAKLKNEPILLQRITGDHQALDFVLFTVWQYVNLASQARRAGRRDMIVNSLNPRIAIRDAISGALREWQKKRKYGPR